MMKLYFRYIIFLFLIPFLINKSDINTIYHVQKCNTEKSSLVQENTAKNNTATKIEFETQFFENLDIISKSFKNYKPFSNYYSIPLRYLEKLLSFTLNIKKKILNSNFLYFQKFHIAYPFHSFW
ncbi:hypothetical protein FLAVO9AF_20024 [Flavobacterium sp. 9AF]|nr:hypothetical protein FLAVO9AF_20024 [Flavobacterium sp. 9AF]